LEGVALIVSIIYQFDEEQQQKYLDDIKSQSLKGLISLGLEAVKNKEA